MTRLPISADDARRPNPPLLGERRARALWDAVGEPPLRPPRAVISGTAGSGKTLALRRLRDRLSMLGLAPVDLDVDRAALDELPPDAVLLVDDLHLRGAADVAAVLRRAADPGAGVVVAVRPWPSTPEIRRIARMLKGPAIVLGEVGRSDVARYLEEVGRTIPERCRTHILEITGGIPWLVSDALASHDEQGCDDDDRHSDLHRALEGRTHYRLDDVPPELRSAIEELCVVWPDRTVSDGIDDETVRDPDDLVRHGHAEGLLLRDGTPVPIVRSAVRASMSPRRLIDLGPAIVAGLIRDPMAVADAGDWLAAVRDASVGDALVRQGDRMQDTHPGRSLELYRRAEECGVSPDRLARRRAEAHWATGDLDAVMVIVDDAPSADESGLTDVAAAVWAARGMMAHADATYRAAPPHDRASGLGATMAATAVGSPRPASADAERDATASRPTTLSAARDLLQSGLSATLHSASGSSLADLVRASELYTSSGSRSPLPELPAVIAAVVALDLGALRTAQSVIDEAVRGRHGGIWARPRLLLWRAWVAVQRARPTAAREALEQARALAPRMSARDALLDGAVAVAIARRYEDAAGLESAWRHARVTLLRADIDLYLLHPLGELLSAAARVGAAGEVARHFAHALEITAALGDPPLWITHLRWAGIQQGILLGDPTVVAPHAKALVAASAHDHVAAVMASAGRVWTSVLAGNVDAAAVEAAAAGLASVGLKWDGARLAGHGAGRTDDRKTAARLLACARELHPTDQQRRATATATEEASNADSTRPAPEEVLSEREIEVARLVLQGKTYAEIGEAIFISPRTAEHHIAHIRHRLGATSRSDVIAKLRQLILEDRPAQGRGVTSDHAGPPSVPLRASG
ncbi:LuxR C-terminal-related transcriptional regulator [Microbacterium sp. H83]|uniref:LuxR C-terminal-related transcriptional regulator n=1 Tax=Microbacterium sp. H83 TaxID=1827324 RepID=UPI0007F48FCA|nr:LuxR C-terminal-related transcriptional regulator [Microbacterium sp. H83]OAN42126.1 hypothetical protein A4X16_10370 [Microbacterium sp. H83]